jgi:hypothetical protein
MVVFGACVSTVHVNVAGVASVPTASVARTSSVCEPSMSPLNVLVHGAYSVESSAQTKELPAFDDVNENVALVEDEGLVGDALIVVSGTVVSGVTAMSTK